MKGKTTIASRPRKSGINAKQVAVVENGAPAKPPSETSSTTGTKRRKLPAEPETKPDRKRIKTSGPDSTSRAAVKPKPSITVPPSQRLDIYVFGSGDFGELGLGPVHSLVKYPRLNKLLDAETVGVVQIVAGGMHCVALTHDQRVITWGVNDNGALGRDTSWEAPTRDIDAMSEDGSDDEGVLNPKESTPAAIPREFFGNSAAEICQVVATDSASFALTTDGLVYGWGTFLGIAGKMGLFEEDALRREEERFQPTPRLVSHLQNIKHLAAGGNHVLALDLKGEVHSWGNGQQSQLGRRIVGGRAERRGLTPTPIGLSRKGIKAISCGGFHSFAMTSQGQVYSWGLNNFGQTGIPSEDAEEESIVEKPTLVPSLKAYNIFEVKAGTHHSIARTVDDKVVVWGRCDDSQMGIQIKDLKREDIIFDSRNRPRILSTPAEIPGLSAQAVAAGADNSLAISTEGEAYSWGFSANYRTGLGTEDPVEVATVIRNKALVGKKLSFASCGGQFSVLAGPAMATDGA